MTTSTAPPRRRRVTPATPRKAGRVIASRRARATPTSKASSSATAAGSPTRSTARATRRWCSCPPWQIVHSRIWKAQIPDFARRHRVIAWDNRGNGRSDRPSEPMAHDDTRAGRQPRRGDGRGRRRGRGARGPLFVLRTDAVLFAAEHPDRVARPRRSSVRPRRSAIPSPGGIVPFEDRLDERRGLEQGEHPLLASRLSAPTSSSSSARPSTSRTPPSRSRTASAGASRRMRRRSLTTATHAADARRRRRSRRCVAAIRAPSLVIQGTDDAITARQPGHRSRGGDPGRPSRAASRVAVTSSMPATRSGSTC